MLEVNKETYRQILQCLKKRAKLYGSTLIIGKLRFKMPKLQLDKDKNENKEKANVIW